MQTLIPEYVSKWKYEMFQMFIEICKDIKKGNAGTGLLLFLPQNKLCAIYLKPLFIMLRCWRKR